MATPAALPRIPERCAGCGRCCMVLEVPADGEDVPREMTTHDLDGAYVMRRSKNGWCVALHPTSRLCRIYPRRPSACREVQSGSWECLEGLSRAIDPAPSA